MTKTWAPALEIGVWFGVWRWTCGLELTIGRRAQRMDGKGIAWTFQICTRCSTQQSSPNDGGTRNLVFSCDVSLPISLQSRGIGQRNSENADGIYCVEIYVELRSLGEMTMSWTGRKGQCFK